MITDDEARALQQELRQRNRDLADTDNARVALKASQRVQEIAQILSDAGWHLVWMKDE